MKLLLKSQPVYSSTVGLPVTAWQRHYGSVTCIDNLETSFKPLPLTFQLIWCFTGAINKLNELTFIPRLHSLKQGWHGLIGSSPVPVPDLRSPPFLEGGGWELSRSPGQWWEGRRCWESHCSHIGRPEKAVEERWRYVAMMKDMGVSHQCVLSAIMPLVSLA